MLLVIAPVSMILDAFNAREHPVAVVSTVYPVTFINASIGIYHATPTIRFITEPEAFKRALVVPHDRASTLALAGPHIALAVVRLACR